MTELLLASLLAGLMGSPHCIGMCGGFASACATSLRSSAAWHAGRLTTYATLGAVAGSLGAVMPGPRWLPLVISALLLAWFAGTLAGVFPQSRMSLPMLTRASARLLARRDAASRYAFGLMTGLLPCGLVYAALSMAVAAGSPLRGAAALLVFGSATIPALAVLSRTVHALAARGVWYRRGLAMLILAAGLWSMGMRMQHTAADATTTHSAHMR